MRFYDEWRPYVSAATRRALAARKIAKLRKSGRKIRPVKIEGRKIAKTFWGESWCVNLEAYSDYSNRLPRGRTYARNGSVIDLWIEAGRVHALVSGSSIYEVEIEIRPLAKTRWKKIKSRCAGKIDSMVELLQGSISTGVMEVVTRRGEGLFPTPKDISLSCSCPDWATMCKHVAATLYGVGARLDDEPEMLFTLRGVDPSELIAAAVADISTRKKKSARGRTLKTAELSSVFGIELETETAPGKKKAARPRLRSKKKVAVKKAVKKTAIKKKPSAKGGAAKKTGAKKSAAKKAVARKAKPAARTKKAAKAPAAKRKKAGK